jgi:flagellar biosynthesis/type III secretory pathway chaperone
MELSDIKVFEQALEKQCRLYEQLLDVLKKETDLLCSEENKNSIISVLKDKIAIMEELRSEDEKISGIKNEWKAMVGPEHPERRNIEGLLRHMEQLLKSILQYEEETSKFFEKFSDQYDNFKNQSSAFRARDAYKDQG